MCDHNAVFVVFDHHSVQHQEQEDVSEDSIPGEGRQKKWDKSPGRRQEKRKKRTKACARFKSGYYQLQRIEADIFSSAPVYVSSPVSERN